jgi:hypothetical protein
MNNLVYVIYDDEMNLLQITSILPETKNYFQIEQSKVKDFYLGFKSYPGHYVKNHGFNRFTIEEKVNTAGIYRYNDLIDLTVQKDSADLMIKYNIETFTWKFMLDADVANLIETNHYDKLLEFYLVKRDQHNFLVRTFVIKLADLINDTLEFRFETEYEHFFENLLIKSKQHFDKIGIYV